MTAVKTRNSSGDEIANVNFFTTTSYTYTFTQCAPEGTEFGEITQNKGHYVADLATNRKLVLVLSSNLSPILHRFRDIAFDRSKIASEVFDILALYKSDYYYYIWLPLLRLIPPPRRRGSPGTI